MSLNGKVAIVTGSMLVWVSLRVNCPAGATAINDVNEEVTAQAVESISNAGGTAVEHCTVG